MKGAALRWPAAALLFAALAALVGCGGGSEVSWCFSGGGSNVSAGYNSTDCPPQPEPPASSPR